MTFSPAAARPTKYDSCRCGGPKRTVAALCKTCRAAVRALPIASRFWPSVDVRGPDDCWEWTGNTNGRYGIVFKANVNGQPTWVYAHRLSYQMAGFPIADGEHVDHLCSNKMCVNPAHLEGVSPRENMLRYYRRTPSNGTRARGPETPQNKERESWA